MPNQPKDRWDKLNASAGLLAFISALLIAAVGGWYSDIYKQKEQRLAETDVVTKMIPFLKAGGPEARAAFIGMANLGNMELAARFAQIFGGPDAIDALEAFTKTASAQDAAIAAKALNALKSASSPSPPERVVVKSSEPELSGQGASFSELYKLCAEAPQGYVIASVDFRLIGDRSCGGWATCTEISRTAQQSCWQFSMQGHNESSGPGQAKSQGVLRLVTKRT